MELPWDGGREGAAKLSERASKASALVDGDVILDGSRGEREEEEQAELTIQKRPRWEASVLRVRRPNDPGYVCACDYNPLCLASLGGSIDVLIHRRATEMAKEELREVADQGHAALSDESIDIDGKIADIKVVDGSAKAADAPGRSQQGGVNLRRSQAVDARMVRNHFVSAVIPFSTSKVAVSITPEEYINHLQKWHNELIHEELLNKNARSATTLDSDAGPNMMLSTPSGLRNLGATCYLNSQFQCLAQNPAFVEGVFSWSGGRAGSGSRMDQVLITMQTLLAQMNCGPESIVCTEPFGNALGLKHGEMQDPNEFARLLFDRMHESFQRSALECATAGHGDSKSSSNVNALAGLLPSLFKGVSSYETICDNCNIKSRTNETFMEITLPLVKHSHPTFRKENLSSGDSEKGAEMNKSNSKKISQGPDAHTEARVDSRDVTIQDCLDAYLYPEMLEDDNQFHCNACGGKNDARRVVSFSELPPVLNILLARYVYDRLTLMKKKLSDRVLLSRTLKVRKRVIGGEEEDIIYTLCAIQNHRGSSAYGGHYIAEAMNWTSGTWFHYNDEDVTHLPNGPHCSYDPSSPSQPTGANGKGRGNGRRATVLRGSSDAYNLFFVERSFLADTAVSQILSNEKRILKTSMFYSSTLSAIDEDAIEKVSRQRRETYRLMNE